MHTIPLAAALGWTAGMRSAMAPALLSRALRGRRTRRTLPRALARPWSRRLLTLAAAGEVAADKVPSMPPRTSPPALAGRVASGALVGAAAAQARRSDLAGGALAGAVGAAAGSFVMEGVRRKAGRALGVPDAAVAVVEDGLALALGTAAARHV